MSIATDYQQFTITKDFDAVIWTDLESTLFEVIAKELGETTAVDYVRSLTVDTFEEAKKYIFDAPAQVQTTYRLASERTFSVDV